MGLTKREIVKAALEEIGLASYEFDITPEELETALKRLDSMIAAWEAKGVRIGYAFGNSDEDQDTGIPQYAEEAVFLSLAIRLAPGYGKMVSGETKRAARDAYSYLLKAAAMPDQQQYPSILPRGAGNRYMGRTYYPRPNTESLQIDSGGDLDFLE